MLSCKAAFKYFAQEMHCLSSQIEGKLEQIKFAENGSPAQLVDISESNAKSPMRVEPNDVFIAK